MTSVQQMLNTVALLINWYFEVHYFSCTRLLLLSKQRYIYSRKLVSFNLVTFQGFLNEVPIFLREHFNGMYRTDVYFITKMISDVPAFLFFPFLFHTITYCMIQFDFTFEKFLLQALVLVTVAQVAASFGETTVY
jgi:hypothetical protein